MPSDNVLTDIVRRDIEHALRWIQPANPAHRILTAVLDLHPGQTEPRQKCHGCPINPTCPSTTCGVPQPEPRAEVTGEVIPWGRVLDLGGKHGMQWAGKTGWRFESDDALYAFANDVARYAIAARPGASS
ncbi:hypothetical protein [Burkholderia sp. MBR-1]|uniref:hypothetical protein n=1 Tax=Burkholderia sp. MBR-1 TaxID=2732364 RepID=UPI0015EEE0D3|nr:hypothetical protein [Burkholderia sp. MBR-1]QMI49709.1 hypothetical protein MBR110_29980 [Burkholderia sp. MBR-1]